MRREKEVWVDLKGFEQHYQISNHGRIKSKTRYVRDRRKYGVFKRLIIGRLMKLSRIETGHLEINLSKNSRYYVRAVHILVATHFLEKKTSRRKQVNHIDYNPANNYYKNLEWVDHRENSFHMRLITKPNKTSKYIGVNFNSKQQKWRATFKSKGKNVWCGHYDSEEEAYSQYKKAIKKAGIKNRYGSQVLQPSIRLKQ